MNYEKKMKLNPKRWLITGGCGFIGTALINQLKNDIDLEKIIILDNLSVGTKNDLKNICDFSENPNDKIFLVEGDVLNKKLCSSLSENIDCIVHLAANTGVPKSVQNPRLDMETNIIGTFNMLEAARENNVEQFIFASSGAPAGEVVPPIHEEIAPHPVSPYGSSKLAGEGYCSSYWFTFGINTIGLRFGNVYGPGSKNKTSVVAKFINNVLNNQVCEIYGDGLQTRDFIYIDDLVNAIKKASRFKKGGEIFQIASGEEFTINELVNVMENIFTGLNYNFNRKYGAKRLGDVQRNFSDTTKANDLLSWKSKTTIEEGLRLTIDYFTRQKLNH